MVKNFRRAADRWMLINGEEIFSSDYISKAELSTGPLPNPSGLFTKDVKPTPVVQPSHRSTTSPAIRTKRKILGTDEALAEAPDCPRQVEERPQKRVRREEASPTEDGQGPSNETSNESMPDVPEGTIEVPAAGESFLKDVEEVLMKKELKRLRRLEKKRKRESAISDVTMIEVEQEAVAPDHRPRKKVRKHAQQNVVDEVETQASTQTPYHSGQTTPHVEKGRNKRLSPASEYLASLLEQSDGRRRSKRQKSSNIG